MPQPQYTPIHEEAVNEKIATLQKNWAEGLSLLHSVRTTFDTLVEYFLPAFPEITTCQAESLAVFCRLYAGSVLLHDSVLDGSGSSCQLSLASMRVGVMQYEGYRILHSLFPANAPYWDLFQKYLAAHSSAFIQEQSFREGRPISEFTEQVGLSIAIGKHSLAKSIIAALVELSGRRELLQPLCLSLDGVATAFQMYDDLEDWRMDLETGSPSILLSRLPGRIPPESETERILFFRQMAKEIYGRGHAIHTLHIALSSLRKCNSEHLSALQIPWTDLSITITHRCESMIHQIEQAIGSK